MSNVYLCIQVLFEVYNLPDFILCFRVLKTISQTIVAHRLFLHFSVNCFEILLTAYFFSQGSIAPNKSAYHVQFFPLKEIGIGKVLQ